MYLNKILQVFLVMIFMLMENCFAMTSSQPVKIGVIGHMNLGGFTFENVTENNGIEKAIQDHAVVLNFLVKELHVLEMFKRCYFFITKKEH